ncbi:hypothetical protein GJ744_008245 [Endocarpon pusillum]|uniref:Core domain-containing protein n=1 Tax=Endocarpon pusillum TaxID=364733 RepID=A0A8H7E5E7_9EURO|nr:hypothetical protein GJ744_008245 [Endocarpon pusillum]
MARRLICQSPAIFFRHCRSKGCQSSVRCSSAVAAPQRTYHSARQLLSLQRVEKSSFPYLFGIAQPNGRARPFTTATPTCATTVLQNPRLDEHGNEMTIEISDRAAKRLQQITSSPSASMSGQNPPQHNHLRVSVTSGGCHGFQYLMSLEPSTAIENDVDTIFASQDSPGSAKVVMDEASLELLKGSTVDYTTELIGSQFKIVGNPRAKSSCGCGTSFDIED